MHEENCKECMKRIKYLISLAVTSWLVLTVCALAVSPDIRKELPFFKDC